MPGTRFFTSIDHLFSKQLPLTSTTVMFISRMREPRQEGSEDVVKLTQSEVRPRYSPRQSGFRAGNFNHTLC